MRTLERDILETWTSCYVDVLSTVADVELDTPSPGTVAAVAAAQDRLRDTLAGLRPSLP